MKIPALRRNLFIKIFLWFWLGFLLINLLFLFVSLITQTEIAPTRSRAMTVKIAAEAAVRLYELGGDSALKDYLQTTETETEIRGYLFDEKGFELTNNQVSIEVSKVIAQISDLNKVESESLGLTTFSAVKIQTAQNRQFIFANEMPRFAFLPILAAKPIVRFWRFPLTLIASGLICFFLARYLTKPIIELRRATRQFAEGNLSVRVSPQFEKRTDELADLSRDFDSMAERLEKNIEIQKRLLGDISHELRSPLTRLNIALSLARASGENKRELLESHDLIELESVRLERLIEQILKLAKLESLDETAEFREINLTEILEIIVADADFEAKSKNRSVTLKIAENCFVKGDQRLLQSAIENIVRNAIRHTKENSSVEITLQNKEFNGEKTAVVAVRDDGSGVPENELNEIFRPFYRVAKARERETGGIGLGLAIAHRAVALHKGKIIAHNTETGGLIIELFLPSIC